MPRSSPDERGFTPNRQKLPERIPRYLPIGRSMRGLHLNARAFIRMLQAIDPKPSQTNADSVINFSETNLRGSHDPRILFYGQPFNFSASGTQRRRSGLPVLTRDSDAYRPNLHRSKPAPGSCRYAAISFRKRPCMIPSEQTRYHFFRPLLRQDRHLGRRRASRSSALFLGHDRGYALEVVVERRQLKVRHLTECCGHDRTQRMAIGTCSRAQDMHEIRCGSL